MYRQIGKGIREKRGMGDSDGLFQKTVDEKGE